MGIMWPRVIKIQYTELKLSCGNDPVVRNSIYSNGDLDLWPNDPKINRVLPLPQGNHVAKIQYTELKLCGNDPVVRNSIYSNRGIMWPSLVKIRYAELKILCGNLCGCPPTIPNHIIQPVSRRAYKNQKFKSLFLSWFRYQVRSCIQILFNWHRSNQ